MLFEKLSVVISGAPIAGITYQIFGKSARQAQKAIALSH